MGKLSRTPYHQFLHGQAGSKQSNTVRKTSIESKIWAKTYNSVNMAVLTQSTAALILAVSAPGGKRSTPPEQPGIASHQNTTLESVGASALVLVH